LPVTNSIPIVGPNRTAASRWQLTTQPGTKAYPVLAPDGQNFVELRLELWIEACGLAQRLNLCVSLRLFALSALGPFFTQGTPRYAEGAENP